MPDDFVPIPRPLLPKEAHPFHRLRTGLPTTGLLGMAADRPLPGDRHFTTAAASLIRGT